MFVIAQHRQVHGEDGLLQDRAAERFARQPPDLTNAVLDFGQGCIRSGLVHPGGQPRGHVIRIEGEQDRGRLEFMERRQRIGQFLKILTEIVLIGVHPDPPAEPGDANRTMQMGQCR